MMPGLASSGPGRPFIFAVVVMLLFLSARSDLENPERKLESAAERGSEKRSAGAKEHEAVSEKIMLDVSVDNERLEEVNRRLRLEVLALRRAVRTAGGVLPAENETLIGVSAAALGLDDLQSAPPAQAGPAQEGVAAADFPPAAEGAAPTTAGAAAAASGEPKPRRVLTSRRALSAGEQARERGLRDFLPRDAAAS